MTKESKFNLLSSGSFTIISFDIKSFHHCTIPWGFTIFPQNPENEYHHHGSKQGNWL